MLNTGPSRRPEPRGGAEGERIFPKVEGRQDHYSHSSFAEGRVAVGLMGSEAEDGGKRLGTAYELTGLYPAARIAMLQFTLGGVEQTSFIFPADRELFNILFSALTEEGIRFSMRTVKDAGAATGSSLAKALEQMKSGENLESVLHMTFDGALTKSAAARLTGYLNDPPSLSVARFPAESGLLGGFITQSFPRRN